MLSLSCVETVVAVILLTTSCCFCLSKYSDSFWVRATSDVKSIEAALADAKISFQVGRDGFIRVFAEYEDAERLLFGYEHEAFFQRSGLLTKFEQSHQQPPAIVKRNVEVSVSNLSLIDEGSGDESGSGLEVDSEETVDGLLFDLPSPPAASTTSEPKRPAALSYLLLNDSFYRNQWYLHQSRNSASFRSIPSFDEINRKSRAPAADMNVVDAWALGYTGKGVNVCILDDNVDFGHDEIKHAFASEISIDFIDNDATPFPEAGIDFPPSHGSRIAGVIASKRNNSKCVAGVAPNVNLGAVRFLTPRVSDRMEGKALSFMNNIVDIYVAAWGPPDDGLSVDSIKKRAAHAIQAGALKGRGGKGNIYMWSSGNGGMKLDSCSIDGYSSSIYTIAIAAVDQGGETPIYAERCSSIFASAYSSTGFTPMESVATIDMNQRCVKNFSGTSAAVALAAAVVALALEANQNLTWRDVKYLIAETARRDVFQKERESFRTNAVGKRSSDYHGFGLLDAKAMVVRAERWRHVPPLKHCWNSLVIVNKTWRGDDLHVPISSDCSIMHLEEVVIEISLDYDRRGNIAVFVTSPHSSQSQLLIERIFDASRAHFRSRKLSSNFFWGEPAAGIWYISIVDRSARSNHVGYVHSVRIEFYGTEEVALESGVSKPTLRPRDLQAVMRNTKSASFVKLYKFLVFLINFINHGV